MSNQEDTAQALAEQFRRRHGLGTSPLPDLFDLAHDCLGVDVLAMECDDGDHGLSVVDPASGRVVIAVATTPHHVRQRSSIAHELGHVLAEHLLEDADTEHGLRTSSEVFADAFARHLLLPIAAAESFQLQAADDVAGFSELVRLYGVSPQIAAIQLYEAGRISLATKRAWSKLTTRQLAAAYGWLNQYDNAAEASERPRAPRSLMSRAVAAYRARKLTVSELALWYEQDKGQLSEELGEPKSHPPKRPDSADWDTPLFPVRGK